MFKRYVLYTITYFTQFTLKKLLEWIDEKPVVDVLETTSFPIEQVEFPTITLCPAISNSDRWGAAIKILDYIERICPVQG